MMSKLLALFIFQWMSFLCNSRFDHSRSLQGGKNGMGCPHLDPHTELDNLISTELDNCLISTELDSEISTQLDNCQISTELDNKFYIKLCC